ncbi:MAG TPA: serine/threonine-protein kinase [Kofleriaceae bacterium]|nr:serine/threonine-protein kinase [Kofleriaceae bacterium]
MAGNYVLDEVLGMGGMGVVYGATQRSLQRRVAVKLPLPELAALPALHARFQREALVAGQLWHRNIVSIIDYGEWHDAPYLVMERVQGMPLGRAVAQRGPFEVEKCVEIAAQILDALAITHAAGFVHGDVKSDNVLLEETRGTVPMVRLFDFGLAADPCTEHPRADVVYGTPEYMAPEVIRGGHPCVGTDVYGTGIILYELLTGATPFPRSTSTDVLAAHLREPIVPPSRKVPTAGIPPALDALIATMLDKRPEVRARDAGQLAAELRATLASSLARGTGRTQVMLASPLDTLRDRITDALGHRDDDATIEAFLGLARALLDAHRAQDAAAELEMAAELLDMAVASGRTVPSLWCIHVTLAAIYGHLGETRKAAEAARAAHQHASRVGSQVAQRRVESVYARIATLRAHPMREGD